MPMKRRLKAGSKRLSSKIIKQAIKRTRSAETQKKLLRENVPEGNFLLSNLGWSSWKPIFAPVSGSLPKGWRVRGQGRQGMRNTKAYSTPDHGSAAYEMAVQIAPKSKCYPVQFFATNGHYDSPQCRLLRQPRARAEVERVLQRGCKVYMRRASLKQKVKVGTEVVKNVKELRNLVKEVYDYPWNTQATKTGRKVLKRNLTIASGQSIVL